MPRLAIGEALEVVTSAALTIALWGHFGWWVGLIAFAVCCFYFAQVAATVELRAPSIRRASFQDGDTVILRIPADLDPDTYATVQAQVQKMLVANRVVVLPSTADIASWHPAGYEPPVVVSRVERLRGVWARATARG